MAGALLETYVVTEILKSWWHRGVRPAAFFYRDKDKREIDLLLVKDQVVYPIEVSQSASPRAGLVRVSSALDRLGIERGSGAVMCLTQQYLPLTRDASAVPVGMI